MTKPKSKPTTSKSWNEGWDKTGCPSNVVLAEKLCLACRRDIEDRLLLYVKEKWQREKSTGIAIRRLTTWQSVKRKDSSCIVRVDWVFYQHSFPFVKANEQACQNPWKLFVVTFCDERSSSKWSIMIEMNRQSASVYVSIWVKLYFVKYSTRVCNNILQTERLQIRKQEKDSYLKYSIYFLSYAFVV